MIRGPRHFASAVIGIGLVAIFAAGCGSVASTSSATPASSSPVPSASIAASHSATARASAAPTASPTLALGLPHVDAVLEDKLPGIIGGVGLQKFSWPVSTYIASVKNGDRTLYRTWLVGLGKSPDDVDMAIATDLTKSENVVIQAIQVPGSNAPALSGGFGDVARAAKWAVSVQNVGPKTVLEVVDPVVDAAGGSGTAYVYAKDNILYLVITDDPALLLEAMIKLP
jgi:hypothetical protein